MTKTPRSLRSRFAVSRLMSPLRALGLRAIRAAWVILFAAAPAWANDVVYTDGKGDARLLRTNLGNSTPFDPQQHRLPDLLSIKMGSFAPDIPCEDLFAGTWSNNGQFARIDLVFDGLVNPPGPVGFSQGLSNYQPYLYGPNPVHGFIEFDMDANENTGGEVNLPEYRYLGNVARWAGRPTESRFADRIAVTRKDFDGGPYTLLPVMRSGEEFHLALLGEQIDQIDVRCEKPGGNPAVFENGETWVLTGDWFHRAHCFEVLSLQCASASGEYMPQCQLQFKHSTCRDQTTVTLVYPLTNAAFASTTNPAQPTQPNNGCPGDQNSVLEALTDLSFSAANADTIGMSKLEFPLLADWAGESPAACLDPSQWRVCALVGSAFATQQSGSARFVWSDVYPNVCTGDFTGDGVLTIADAQALTAFIAEFDGDDDFDDDHNHHNNRIVLHNYAKNFCLYDTNYDGIIIQSDALLMGDMDWNGLFTTADIAAFVTGLLRPDEYATSYSGHAAVDHGDLNGDGKLDGLDIAEFVRLLTNL